MLASLDPYPSRIHPPGPADVGHHPKEMNRRDRVGICKRTELMPVRLAPTVYLAAGCERPLGEILGPEADDVPDVVDRTCSLVDEALGRRETAATPAGSRT